MRLARTLPLLLVATVAAVAAALACGSAGQDGAVDPAPERPNVLLVLADDMGWSDLGCFGSEIRTPAIDALADGGLRFTHFYDAGRCCPTRASLLTGLYPHEAGIGHMTSDFGTPAYRGDLGPDAVTIAEALGRAGYATFMAGKWHVTKHVGAWLGWPELASKHNWPLQRGFERFYGTIHAAGSFFDPITLVRGDRPVGPQGEDYYYTDAITDAALGFLREHFERDDARPFFGYVAYTAPHWPLHARAEDVEGYAGAYDAGWEAVRDARIERARELGVFDVDAPASPREPRDAWEDDPDRAWQARRMEVYAAQVESMDRGIGRLVALLRERGALDDTLVLFLADNGASAEELGARAGGLHVPARTRDGRRVQAGNLPAVMPGPADTYQSPGRAWANVSNAPLRLYKSWMHEGGIATPLVVHWPARIAERGALRHEPGHVADVLATCLDVAGAPYPRERDGVATRPLAGVSLARAFAGEPLPERALFWEHEGNRAVRRGRWKLVSAWTPGGGAWELYDLAADRAETRDLAAERPELVRELAGLWAGWAQRVGVLEWPIGR